MGGRLDCGAAAAPTAVCGGVAGVAGTAGVAAPAGVCSAASDTCVARTPPIRQHASERRMVVNLIARLPLIRLMREPARSEHPRSVQHLLRLVRSQRAR